MTVNERLWDNEIGVFVRLHRRRDLNRDLQYGALNRLSETSRKLTILAYHRVLPEADQLVPDQTTAALFLVHVATLAKYFNVLRLADAARRLKAGTLPHRAVSITFDDGYKDNFKVALPILRLHNIPATFFIATDFLDGGRMWNDTIIETVRGCQNSMLDLRDLDLGIWPLGTLAEKRLAMDWILSQTKYMSQSERDSMVGKISERAVSDLPLDLMMTSRNVTDMHNAGMEIGAHTLSHPILTKVPDTLARKEIGKSKRSLEQLTGSSVETFAYPNGKPMQDYDKRHVKMVQQAGFVAAVTTAQGCTGQKSDLFQLGRVGVWDRTPLRFGVRLLAISFSGQPTEC